MDLYTVFKFLHILAATAWAGGMFLMLARSTFSIRDIGEAATLRTIGIVRNMGIRWFIPAVLLAVLFGLAMTALGSLWGELWVLLALAGFAATFVLGHSILRPHGIALEAAMTAGREDEALLHGRAMLGYARFDATLMAVLFADMVFRPGWTYYPILALMAAVLLAAAILFLRPAMRPA